MVVFLVLVGSRSSVLELSRSGAGSVLQDFQVTGCLAFRAELDASLELVVLHDDGHLQPCVGPVNTTGCLAFCCTFPRFALHVQVAEDECVLPSSSIRDSQLIPFSKGSMVGTSMVRSRTEEVVWYRTILMFVGGHLKCLLVWAPVLFQILIPMCARFYYELLPPAINVMMGIAIAWFSFQKLDGHKQTLDQMESFDLRNAQCTLETDRVVLQRLVQDLFDEALEPPLSVSLDAGEVSETDTDSLSPLVLKQSLQDVRHVTSYPTEGEVIDQFNAYVRGPLRDRVMSLIGREIDISLELRAVSNLPLVLLGVFLVFSCDRHSNCSGALIEGYSSVSHYILTTAVVNCVIVPLILVAFTFPLALRANHLLTLVVKGKVLRMLCGIFVSTLVLALNNAWAAAGAAGMMVIMCEPSTIGVAVYLGLGFLMCCSAWFLHPNMARTQRQPAVSVAKTFCFAG